MHSSLVLWTHLLRIYVLEVDEWQKHLTRSVNLGNQH